MKSASINEIKKEISNMPPLLIAELCMRLAKFKKENKELLSYLLFEAYDEQEYIKNVKLEIDSQFEDLNINNLYFAKKGLRKILKLITKQIKFSGQKKTEVELLIYFCYKLRDSEIAINSSIALINLYQMQIKKINKAIASLHEDLRYDYELEIQNL